MFWMIDRYGVWIAKRGTGESDVGAQCNSTQHRNSVFYWVKGEVYRIDIQPTVFAREIRRLSSAL